MAVETALRELVLDQPIRRRGVGHAQQRLGQDHEGQTLLGRQGIFAKQEFDVADTALLRAHRADKRAREVVDPRLTIG